MTPSHWGYFQLPSNWNRPSTSTPEPCCHHPCPVSFCCIPLYSFCVCTLAEQIVLGQALLLSPLQGGMCKELINNSHTVAVWPQWQGVGQIHFSLSKWPRKTQLLVRLDILRLLIAFVSIILTNQFSTWLPGCQFHSGQIQSTFMGQTEKEGPRQLCRALRPLPLHDRYWLWRLKI